MKCPDAGKANSATEIRTLPWCSHALRKSRPHLHLGLAALIATQLAGQCRVRRFAIAGLPLAVAALLTVQAPAWDPLLMTTGVYMYASKMVRLGVDHYRQAQARAASCSIWISPAS